MERARRSCGFTNGIDVGSEDTRGGLCLAWRNDISHFRIFLEDILTWQWKIMKSLLNGTLQECQLNDVGFSGSWFTWERENLPETNIQERLDRGVANVKGMLMFSELSQEGMKKSEKEIVLNLKFGGY
ncbi:hypothetical protein EPI10_019832 [Gossypium australe]|uniref:Reverse transcriptase n=1 Tax=Gossypium australe TaxID=47621 RepID=A0A5B6WDT2_9ROSI|nr:hypothetical protein EPI10_019832 [Gossypium australe]